MKLLVGLGNPGSEYANNRHNVGFMALERIARLYSLGPFRNKFQGRITDGPIEGVRVICLMPETYMNRSGQAVVEASRFYKIPPEGIIVFHDDLDLAPFKVKIKKGGGHGGHNGLRDIDAHIGPEYWRVRLGIGHPGDKARVHSYVLSDFSKAERDNLEKLLDALGKTTPLLLGNKVSDVMTRIANLMRPAKETVNKDHTEDRKSKPPETAKAETIKKAEPESGLSLALKNALSKRGGNNTEGTV